MNIPERNLKSFAHQTLEKIREFVHLENLDIHRLPGWVKSANVRWASLNNSLIFLFEDSSLENDTFTNSGDVKSDVQFLLDLPEFIPRAACLKAPDRPSGGLIIFEGEHGEGKSVTININSNNSSIFNIGYTNYHVPIAILNIFIQLLTPTGRNGSSEIAAIRFVPFAIFIHIDDFSDFKALWNRCATHIECSLKRIHDLEGDFYQSQWLPKEAFQITKEKSVIVLGKYSGSELNELRQVRDYLRAKGYDAHLIEDLPEHPMISNEEKVRYWTGGSRFCVMIDREAAGHIAEYEYLKTQRTILAFLRPKGEASTYMIGDVHLVDFQHINLFEFEKSSLDIMGVVIDWAEKLAKKRAEEYEKFYPWRASD